MTTKIVGRVFLLIGVLLLGILWAWEAKPEDLTVVEVRSNIPLAEKDSVYHDYYINSGSNQGLKPHLVVTATRKITVRDATGTQTYGEMMTPVGQLKIIFVGEKFAVAREVKLISREDQPMLEQTGIMIGDKVELKGSFVDNRKIPSQKSAEKAQVRAEPPAVPTDATAAVQAATTSPTAATAKTAATATAVAPTISEPVDLPSVEKQSGKPEDEIEKTASADDSSI